MLPAILLSILLGAGGTEDPLPRRLRLDEPVLQLPLAQAEVASMQLGVTLGAQARATLPYGSVGRGTVTVGTDTVTVLDNSDYSQLFFPGWGVTLEADLMFRPPPPPPGGPPWANTPELGGYVAFEWDWFDGSDAQDSAGTSVKPESLRVASVYAGFKVAGIVEWSVFGDVRFGLGAAHVPSLDATFQSPGGPAIKGELFADSWTFAMELRGHFGWRVGGAGVGFGMGGRLIAPPRRGANSTMDPGIFYTFDFEFGVELGF